MVREIKEDELSQLLELYLHLHEDNIPEITEQLLNVWQQIRSNSNHHIIVNIVNHKIVSSCVCIIIPNLTRNFRPYALIENVVTHEAFRGKGYASECLRYAEGISTSKNCYKIMLMTSAKDSATLQFYRTAGFNSIDKTAFIKKL